MKQERVGLPRCGPTSPSGWSAADPARRVLRRIGEGPACRMCGCSPPSRRSDPVPRRPDDRGRPGAGRLQLGLGGTGAEQASRSSVAACPRRVRRPRRPRPRRSPCRAASQLTDQGSKLAFGDTGDGGLRADAEGKGTVLQLTVKGVRKGRLADFKGFILDDSLQAEGVLLLRHGAGEERRRGRRRRRAASRCGASTPPTRCCPAVNFTTSFKPCPSKPLPAKFAHRRDAEHLPGLPLARPGHARGR